MPYTERNEVSHVQKLEPSMFIGNRGNQGAYQSRASMIRIQQKKKYANQNDQEMMVEEVDDLFDDRPQTPSSDGKTAVIQPILSDSKNQKMNLSQLEQQVVKGAMEFVNITEEIQGQVSLRQRKTDRSSQGMNKGKSISLQVAQKRHEEMKERLANIEKQVEMKQKELEDYRKQSPFQNMPQTAFSPPMSDQPQYNYQEPTDNSNYYQQPKASAMTEVQNLQDHQGLATVRSFESPMQHQKRQNGPKLVSNQKRLTTQISNTPINQNLRLSPRQKSEAAQTQRNNQEVLQSYRGQTQNASVIMQKNGRAYGDNFKSPNVSDFMEADYDQREDKLSKDSAQAFLKVQKGPSTSRNRDVTSSQGQLQAWKGNSTRGILNALHNSSQSLQSLGHDPMDPGLEKQIEEGSVIMHPQDRKKIQRNELLYGQNSQRSGAISTRQQPRGMTHSYNNVSSTSLSSQQKLKSSRSKKKLDQSRDSGKKPPRNKAIYTYEGLTERATGYQQEADLIHLDFGQPLDGPFDESEPVAAIVIENNKSNYSSASSQLPMPEECSALRPVKMESNPNNLKSNLTDSNESNERKAESLERQNTHLRSKLSSKISPERILQILLKDEDILYRYATSTPQTLQVVENQKQVRDDHTLEYESLLTLWRPQNNTQQNQMFADKRPRLAMFSRQLQLSFIIFKTMIRVLPVSLLNKYGHIFKQLGQQIHQNFLLLVDVVIRDLEQQPQLNMSTSVDFKLLKNIANKKIISKDSFARIMTIYRQNNEFNCQNLKKVLKYILNANNSECLPYKVLAYDLQEIMRTNFGSSSPTGQITCSVINKQLMRKADVLVKSVIQHNEDAHRKVAAKNGALGGRASPNLIQSQFGFDIQEDESPRDDYSYSPEPVKQNLTDKLEDLHRSKSTNKKSTLAQRQYMKSSQQAQQTLASYGITPNAGQSTTINAYLQNRNRLVQQQLARRKRPDPLDTNESSLMKPVGNVSPAVQPSSSSTSQLEQQIEPDCNKSRLLSNSKKGSVTEKGRERKIDGLINQSTKQNMSILAQRKAAQQVSQQKLNKTRVEPTPIQGSRQQVASRQSAAKTPQRVRSPITNQQTMQAYKDAQQHMKRKKFDINAQQAASEAGELMSQKSFGSIGFKSSMYSPQKKNKDELVSPSKVNSLMRRYGSAGKASMSNQSNIVVNNPNSIKGAKQHNFTVRKQTNNFMPTSQPVKPVRVVDQSPNESFVSNLAMQQKKLFGQPPVEKSKSFVDVPSRQNGEGMLQETRDFVMRVHDLNQSSSVIQQPRTLEVPQDDRMMVANFNNNINFYGTVVNHVYPNQMQFQSIQEQPELPQSAQPRMSRLTTDKKSIGQRDEFEEKVVEDQSEFHKRSIKALQTQKSRQEEFERSPEPITSLLSSGTKTLNNTTNINQRIADEGVNQLASPSKLRNIKSGIGSGTKNLKNKTMFSKRSSFVDSNTSALSPEGLRLQQTDVLLSAEPSPLLDNRKNSLKVEQLSDIDPEADKSAIPLREFSLDDDEDEFLQFEQRIDEEFRMVNTQQSDNLNIMQYESKRSNDLQTPVPEHNLDIEPEEQLQSPNEHLTNKKYDQQMDAEVNEIGPHNTQIDDTPSPQPKPNADDAISINNPTNADEDDEQALIDAEYAKLKALVKFPYLPPLTTSSYKLPRKAKGGIYTLVLDLDETLIHFEIDPDVDANVEDPGYYLIRPGCNRFLQELSDYFEVVVFTAAMPDYADWILDNIDPENKYISHRLYRQHTTPTDDYAIKDLHNLGRDLSRTIIIDNLAENFNSTTPFNGIWIQSWYDDLEDNMLPLLIPFLIELVVTKVDVRHLLTEEIKQEMIYKSLEEGRLIPSVDDLLDRYPPNPEVQKLGGNAES